MFSNLSGCKKQLALSHVRAEDQTESGLSSLSNQWAITRITPCSLYPPPLACRVGDSGLIAVFLRREFHRTVFKMLKEGLEQTLSCETHPKADGVNPSPCKPFSPRKSNRVSQWLARDNRRLTLEVFSSHKVSFWQVPSSFKRTPFQNLMLRNSHSPGCPFFSQQLGARTVLRRQVHIPRYKLM